jgi:hypothetical protein
MRSSQTSLFLAFFCLISPALSTGRAQAPATAPSPTSAQVSSIDAVVLQVKQALADVQTTLANSKLPPLKQVKLSLQTTATKKGGFVLKLWVINIGTTYEKDKTQQIDIVLVPPAPGAPRVVSSASITQELEDAIVTTAEGVKNASTGPVPLKVSNLDIQIGFTVKGDVNGGAAITILPITADFSGDLSKTAIQTLTVSFAEPAPPK